MKLQWKKGRKYPKLAQCLAVMWRTWYCGTFKGKYIISETAECRHFIDVAVEFSTKSHYRVDASDQSDVLKLAGWKSLCMGKAPDRNYIVSCTEEILGFRRKKQDDFHFEIGIHRRRDKHREKFRPMRLQVHALGVKRLLKPKGLMLPIAPYFGGFDNNGDGLGGRAPHDVELEIWIS